MAAKETESSSPDNSDVEDEEYDTSESARFIPVYEEYLSNRSIVERKTRHANSYKNNPFKTLRDWFENEGSEFKVREDQAGINKFTATIDLPIGDHDFEVKSESHDKKQAAIDEVCMHSCWLLDESGLLFRLLGEAQNEAEIRKRIDEANKEDDIEYDNTCSKKRHRETSESDSRDAEQPSSSKPKINTYESLMADWSKLNMSILQLKAKLVKLDVEFAQGQSESIETNNEKEEDEEEDPLDAYMSSLESQNRKPSLDDKIEKSRLKTQISSLEREQAQVSRLIELAKPTFDLNKVCPLKPNPHSGAHH